jgi:hypothetical protein
VRLARSDEIDEIGNMRRNRHVKSDKTDEFHYRMHNVQGPGEVTIVEGRGARPTRPHTIAGSSQEHRIVESQLGGAS